MVSLAAVLTTALAIVGGLFVSQLRMLYAVPVVYLQLDRLRLRFSAFFKARKHPHHPRPQGKLSTT